MTNTTPSPHILIISEEDDAHIPFVSKYLTREQFLIIDPMTISKGNELSYRLKNDEIVVIYKGITLEKVRSVWYRKPNLPEKASLPLPDGYKDYSYDALKKHVSWLFNRFKHATWISSYQALDLASDKMSQLQLAKKLGFLVPDTVQTSDPTRAKNFMQEYPSTIIKPVSAFGFSRKDEQDNDIATFFYAIKVTKEDEIDLSNLEFAPTIFQQAIEGVVGDLRVNVVGKKVFAAIITNPGIKDIKNTRDWRIGDDIGTIEIHPYKLPRDIANKCISHVHEQGLTFGALDLILDNQEKIWFIENNPNGQWAFVEQATKQPIGEEIAYFLSNGKNS